jgi:hypothetical protein
MVVDVLVKLVYSIAMAGMASATLAPAPVFRLEL